MGNEERLVVLESARRAERIARQNADGQAGAANRQAADTPQARNPREARTIAASKSKLKPPSPNKPSFKLRPRPWALAAPPVEQTAGAGTTSNETLPSTTSTPSPDDPARDSEPVALRTSLPEADAEGALAAGA